MEVEAELSTRPVKLRLTKLLDQARNKMRGLPVWKVLLGVDKGHWYVSTAVLLLVYNLCRLFLTVKVTALNDEQNRTGYAPGLRDYRWLRWPHWIVSILLLFAVGSFLFHFYGWMTATVWLPK